MLRHATNIIGPNRDNKIRLGQLELNRIEFFELHLKRMQGHLRGVRQGTSTTHSNFYADFTVQEIEAIYVRILQSLARHVEQFLLSDTSVPDGIGGLSGDKSLWKPKGNDHSKKVSVQEKYLTFGVELVGVMMRYTNHIYPVDKLASSLVPLAKYPREYEQKYFEDKLASYGRSTKVTAPNFALLHFCIGMYRVASMDLYKLDMMCTNIENIILDGIRSIAGYPFSEAVDDDQRQGDEFRLAIFLLSHILPVLIHTAYRTEHGWSIAEPYLVAAARVFEKIGPADNMALMHAMVPVMQTMVDGIAFMQPSNALQEDARHPGYQLTTIHVFRLLTAASGHILEGIELARGRTTEAVADSGSRSVASIYMDQLQGYARQMQRQTFLPSTGLAVDLSWKMMPFQKIHRQYAPVVMADLRKERYPARSPMLEDHEDYADFLFEALYEFLDETSRLHPAPQSRKKDRRSGGNVFTGFMF